MKLNLGENMRKKVSIIIPYYNAEKTLKRCLDSVIKQTYPNLEVLVINDGSKDNSQKVVNRYEKKYPFIKLINKVNGGVSSARNLGLDLATGEYIMFLDSDDNYTKKNAIEKMVNKLEETGVDCVACSTVHPVFKTFLRGGKYDLTNTKQKMKYFEDFMAFGMPWNKVFKREVLTEKYEEKMKFTEDELFNIANLPNIKSVYFINEILHNYYCAPKTETNTSAINTIQLKKDDEQNRDGFFFKRYDNRDLRDPVVYKNNSKAIANKMIHGRYVYFEVFDVEFMKYLEVPIKEQYKSISYSITSPEFMETLKKCETRYRKLVTTNVEGLKKLACKYVDVINNPQKNPKINRVKYMLDEFYNLFYKKV